MCGGISGIQVGPTVEVAMCDEVTYLGELSVCGAQHTPVELSSVQWKRSAIPVNRRGAEHTPDMSPPFTLAANYGPVLCSLHVHMLDPRLLLEAMKRLAFLVS
jgi:hypothetical protein